MQAWRRRAATPEEAAPDSEPMAVFHIDGIVEGWAEALERRVSDGLNAGEPLRVRAPNPDGTPGEWMDLNLDDVVAVAPAPRPASRARVSRRLHPVEVQAGRYAFSGIAHLPVGADPHRYVGNTSRWWLPLTECTVAAGEDAWAVDVVIVNLDHASRTPKVGLTQNTSSASE